MFHHPHAIDYAALLVVKRVAEGQPIDRDGWKEAAYDLIRRHLALNHHHEIVWLLWLLLTVDLEVSEQLATECCRNQNAHILSMLAAANQKGMLGRRPDICFKNKLASTDDEWLLDLVSRSSGFTKAAFGGSLAEEFEHLATKKVR